MQNTSFPRLSKVKILRRQDKWFFLTFFWVLIGQKQVFLPAEKIKEGKKPTFKFYFFSEKSVTGYEATLNKLL